MARNQAKANFVFFQIEGDNDPREDIPEHAPPSERPSVDLETLHSHNPWAGERFDPGEGAFEERVTQHFGPDGSMHVTRVVLRSDSPRQAGHGRSVNPSPVFDSFQRMMQSIMGAQLPASYGPQSSGPGFPPSEHAHEHQHWHGRAPGPPTEGSNLPGQRPFGFTMVQPGEGGGSPMIGGSFTYSTTSGLRPRDANNPQPPNQPVADLPE